MVSAVVAEGSAPFVHWGVVQISVANLVVIGLMLVVFVIAVLTPLGRESTSVEPGTEP